MTHPLRLLLLLLIAIGSLLVALMAGVSDVWLATYLLWAFEAMEARVIVFGPRHVRLTVSINGSVGTEPIRMDAGDSVDIRLRFHAFWTCRLVAVSWRVPGVGRSMSGWGWLGVRGRLVVEDSFGPLARGEFQFGRIEPQLHGWLGTKVDLSIQDDTDLPRLLVHPGRCKVDALFVTTEWKRMEHKHFGDSVDRLSVGTRPYRMGDRMSQIHWPASLRGDELFVREHIPIQQPIHIFLLGHSTAYANQATYEWAISLSASLMEACINRGHQVVVSFCGRTFAVDHPKSPDGWLEFRYALDAFAGMDPYPLESLLMPDFTILPQKRHLNILIAPLGQESDNAAAHWHDALWLIPSLCVTDETTMPPLDNGLFALQGAGTANAAQFVPSNRWSASPW